MYQDPSIGKIKVYYVVKKIFHITSTKTVVRTIERLSNNGGRRLRKRHLKVNSRCFKLYPAYSNSSIHKMLVNFSGVEFLKTVSKFRKRSRRLVFTSSTKREIRHFHVAVVQQRQRNVQNSVIHVQTCFANQSKPFASLPFSLPSPSSLLKLPNNRKIKIHVYAKRQTLIFTTWPS